VYPSEAVIVRDQAWSYTQLYSNIAYNFVTGTKPDEVKPAASASSKGVVDTVLEFPSDALNKITGLFKSDKPTTVTPVAPTVKESAAVAVVAEDTGMSNPADADMYSARER